MLEGGGRQQGRAVLAGAPHRDFTHSRLMVGKQTPYEAWNDVCSLWREK